MPHDKLRLTEDQALLAAVRTADGKDDIVALVSLVMAQQHREELQALKDVARALRRFNRQRKRNQCRWQTLTAAIAAKGDLDSISEMGEMESLRLQMAMDRLSKMMSTLSNILKKISDTAQSITQNIK